MEENCFHAPKRSLNSLADIWLSMRIYRGKNLRTNISNKTIIFGKLYRWKLSHDTCYVWVTCCLIYTLGGNVGECKPIKMTRILNIHLKISQIYFFSNFYGSIIVSRNRAHKNANLAWTGRTKSSAVNHQYTMVIRNLQQRMKICVIVGRCSSLDVLDFISYTLFSLDFFYLSVCFQFSDASGSLPSKE